MKTKTPTKLTTKAFPAATFRRLLTRYVQENFSRKTVRDYAATDGSPYIGVCIGDASGNYAKPIIDGMAAEDIFAGVHGRK